MAGQGRVGRRLPTARYSVSHGVRMTDMYEAASVHRRKVAVWSVDGPQVALPKAGNRTSKKTHK